MESIERLQRRIGTLSGLQTIVRNMKALSAVSVRQYENAAQSLSEYFRTVELGLHVVLRDTGSTPEPITRPDEPRRRAAVVFGTDHGLCGRFNEDIAAYAIQRVQEPDANHEAWRLLAVGSRVAASLDHLGLTVEEEFLVPGSAARITATVQQVLLKIDEWRSQGDIHHVDIFYNHHLSRGGYRPTGVSLLPVDLRRFQRLEEAAWPSNRLPTYTMKREDLFSALLSQYFFVSIFRACAESQASEHANRLAAMQSAEKNLDEKLEEITTQFRRIRQEAITAELLDVVSGYEAVAAENYSE